MKMTMLSGNQRGTIVDMGKAEAEAAAASGMAEAVSTVPKLIGGNVFELADGTRVRGKRKAEAAAADLAAG